MDCPIIECATNHNLLLGALMQLPECSKRHCTGQHYECNKRCSSGSQHHFWWLRKHCLLVSHQVQAHEFVPHSDKQDKLIHSDADLVKMEMDMYWITKGKQNPETIFNQHPGE